MGHDYFGGIDFSGAREPLSNLWAAVGVERDGRLHVIDLRPLPFRADLLEHVAGGWREPVAAAADSAILWGADFPFGLPIAAAMMLVDGDGEPAWDEVVRAVSAMDADAVREACVGMSKATRRCDDCGAMAPLDLRLYKQTVAGMRWLDELRCAAEVSILPQSPRDGAACTVIEVYPSITRADLGVKGGKGPRKVGEVRAWPAALSAWVSFGHPSIAATASGIEDARDAVLACVTAWLVREDLGQPQRTGDNSAFMIEGWIYRHPEAGVVADRHRSRQH
jgi:hypothetical protein